MNEQFNRNDWDSKPDWNAKIKLCKVYQKTNKNGKTYLMGNFNNNAILTVSQGFKQDEWVVELTPVKWTKKGEQSSYQSAPQAQKSASPGSGQYVKKNIDELSADDFSSVGEEVPF